MTSEPTRHDEEHLRALFASSAAQAPGDSGQLLDRIVTGAVQRRRRSAVLTVVGTAGSTLAVVAALVAGPGLLSSSRDLALPASSGSGSVSPTATAEPTADSTITAPTATIIATSAPATRSTATATGPTTPTTTATKPRAEAPRDYAGLVDLFPNPSTLGPGMTWGLDPLLSAAGAAPVMGFHYCDAIDVPKQIGEDTYAAAEKQVTSAIGSVSMGADWPSVDIVLAAWSPGRGATAMQQIRSNTGMCVWLGSPTPTAWAGHDGLLITTDEVLFSKWHQAAAIQLVGDITVGVSVVDTSTGVALERAKVLCDRMAAVVRASGLGQG